MSDKDGLGASEVRNPQPIDNAMQMLADEAERLMLLARAESAEKALADAVFHRDNALKIGADLRNELAEARNRASSLAMGHHAEGVQCGVCSLHKASMAVGAKELAEARERIARLDGENEMQACDETDLRAQITELQAANVAMREALARYCHNDDGSCIGCWGAIDEHSPGCLVGAALSSPNPGAPLLAALAQAREVLEKVVASVNSWKERNAEKIAPTEPALWTSVANALAQLRALTGGGE